MPAFAAPAGAERIRARARKSRSSKRFRGIWNRRWGRICAICRSPRPPFTLWTRMWPSPRPARCFPISSTRTARRASSWSPKNLTPRKVIRCCRWARRDCSATSEAREQLPRALPLVADGGFWVPRSVLSGFVDSVLAGSHSRRLKVDTAADLSRREQEVLNSLLENLANKEIGSKLNISERTVKFHVSNLLNKFGVRRRADLILLCYQKRSVTRLEISVSRTYVSRFVIGNWAQRRGERVLRRLESCYSRLDR